ncbi:MAG TPA: hypothetical protein PLA68_16245, partial [Panacibacter sp.]|nr:hypothetical protein [Panacibacter sp.]
YRQRTRSYAFLITLAISLYLAYTFVPAPGADYSTVKIGKYVGENNAAWIGHVMAIMTSVFLSLFGFYLVNNSIKKDIDTEVGMIIATTPISNFKYLLTKMLSNFLLLLTITGIVFIMGIVLFFVRSNGGSFNPVQFILPWLLTTVPSVFLISALAVLAEVFLGKWPMLQYIGFFFYFGIITANILPGAGSTTKMMLDPFGVKVVMTGMENLVQQHYDAKATMGSVGFNLTDNQEIKTFLFSGMPWPALFIFSRLLWIGISLLLIFISSKFFHRFNFRETVRVSKKKKELTANNSAGNLLQDIQLSSLPAVQTDYGIVPFIKTEMLMLFRKGSRWLWLVNIAGMIALIFTPLNIAHQMVLPLLWFLQVARWSDLATKEKTNRIHYFAFASYQPLKRLLPSQLIAGILLALALALPLMIRYLAAGDALQVLYIFNGAIFIVTLALCLGIISGGKKIFEILFFAITYFNFNLIPFADYFGGISHYASYPVVIPVITALLIVAGFSIRKYELGHL